MYPCKKTNQVNLKKKTSPPILESTGVMRRTAARTCQAPEPFRLLRHCRESLCQATIFERRRQRVLVKILRAYACILDIYSIL